MRIYKDPMEAFREVERDLFEMGIDVHPQTMQDKIVATDEDYRTKELQAYGFQIADYRWTPEDEAVSVNYVLTGDFKAAPGEGFDQIMKYIDQEFKDRTCGVAMNPGNSYRERSELWREFMHGGKFAYTYSERMAPQLKRILHELQLRQETRQAIINIHSNIQASNVMWDNPDTGQNVRDVRQGADLVNMGGQSRIPCSMYYQIMRRRNKVDLIYTMRSCDYLTHFPVDIMLALRLQSWFADQLGIESGRFTYFTGSLHGYAKDLKKRGIF